MKTKHVKKQVKKTLTIRWIQPNDVNQVLEVNTTSCEHFWDKEYIGKLFNTDNVIGVGAFMGEKLVGFMVLHFDHTNHEVQMLNLVIIPEFKRKKIGSRLMAKAKTFNPHYNIVLVVRETNLIAHKFLKASSFRAVGVSKNFFEDEWKSGDEKEDGYIFAFQQPSQVESKS